MTADGRGTEPGDRSEARALGRVLGDRIDEVPVSAPKSMVGNSLAGAGPIDAAFTLLAMRDGVIAPTINVERQDPECRLDLVAGQPARGAGRRGARGLPRHYRRQRGARAQT